MWINRAKYNSLLKCLDEAISSNYELRKVCQCRECKWYQYRGEVAEGCRNPNSDNFCETMNPYGSCEKCERK
jgi:hypothetical protein